MRVAKDIIKVITVTSIISIGSVAFAQNGYWNHMGNNNSMKYDNHMGDQNRYHYNNGYHYNNRNSMNKRYNNYSERIEEQKRARKFGRRIYRGQTNLKGKSSNQNYIKKSDK